MHTGSGVLFELLSRWHSIIVLSAVYIYVRDVVNYRPGNCNTSFVTKLSESKMTKYMYSSQPMSITFVTSYSTH
jgi:hypothetical protein